jgi:hypothetical protein
MPKGLRRQCTICCHPERGRIDYLLVCSAGSHGEGRRALANKFGVSADALWRHGKNHISDEYRAAVKIGPFENEDALRKLLAETGASVLDRYNAVYAGHLSRWLVALESGNDDAMIKHGSVMAALLAKVGILTREMLPPGAHQQITQNFFATPDFYSFQRRALNVLRQFPEVLDAWREEFAPQIGEQKLIEAAPNVVATD